MKSFFHIPPILIIALGVCVSSMRAEDKMLEGESLGKIKLGQKAGQITALLGKPSSRGEDTLWEAIGEWVQEWGFAAHGVTLNMASETKGGAKTVSSIKATRPCKLATARGIQIGSSEAAVRTAYQDVQDKESSIAGKTFVAGSVYGGVIFTLQGGKVVEIFVGAAAE